MADNPATGGFTASNTNLTHNVQENTFSALSGRPGFKLYSKGLSFNAATEGMDVGFEGINTNKFPPAAKYTLHVRNSAFCGDFSPHIDAATSLFPEPCRPEVHRRLSDGDILGAIRVVNHGTGVHVIFEFPLKLPLIGDIVSQITGSVWGPWVYPI